MNFFLKILCWVFLCGSSLFYPLFGQINNPILANSPFSFNSEIGHPYLRNYTQTDFKGEKNYTPSQTWSIARDNRGVMYFGYILGVLEYDGNAWHQIELPNFAAMSLTTDDKGTVYVGGKGVLGYLAVDKSGAAKFISLTNFIPPADRAFRDVWSVFSTKVGVYFQSANRLFRWSGDSMRVWKPQTSFHVGFKVRDRYYLRQRQIGLMQVIDDSLTLVSQGDTFATIRMYAMMPFPEQKTLIVTREKGLFLYEGKKTIIPFPTDADAYLHENPLYHGAQLSDTTFALATLNSGVVVIDTNGKRRYNLNRSTGILDDHVKCVFPDESGGQWLALNTGISHVEPPALLSVMDERVGVKGTVSAITRHQGMIFIGTSDGAFYLSPPSKRKRALEHSIKFLPIPGLGVRCWHLLSTSHALLLATDAGIYAVKRQKATLIYEGNVRFLHRSKQDKNKIFAGLSSGLGVLNFSENEWRYTRRVRGIKEEIRTIVETGDGKLWLETLWEGLLMADFSSINPEYSKANFPFNPKINRFSETHGIPRGKYVNVFKISGDILFATEEGVRQFDSQHSSFIPNSIFGEAFANGSRSPFRMAEDAEGNVWMHTKNNENIVALHQADGTYKLAEKLLRRIPYTQIDVIYPEENGIIWFGGDDGLVRYNSNLKRNHENDFPTLINKVLINSDSVLVGGSHVEGWPRNPNLSYQNNSLHFEYAAPSYENESANRFQYYLVGFDRGWSGWSAENKKDYTNLPEGNYRFRVQAKNVYEHLGREAAFSFTILPPWYRTWWAYGFYVLLFAASVFGLVRYQVSRANRITQEKLRREYLEKELDTARDIQRNLLPKESLSVAGVEIAAACIPAYEVAGDHFDYFWIDEAQEELAILLVDVEGKRMGGAIPSILINGMVKTAIQSEGKKNISNIFHLLNRLLYEKFQGQVSVSLIIGILNVKTRHFFFANAGCPSPLFKNNESVSSLQQNWKNFRPPLGRITVDIVNHAKDIEEMYPRFAHSFQTGDLLIIHSDGISEVTNREGKAFGKELSTVIRNTDKEASAETILKHIFTNLKTFSEDRNDDQTLIVIRL